MHANVTAILNNSVGGQLDSVSFRVDGDGTNVTLQHVADAVQKVSGGWILSEGDQISINVDIHE